MTALTIRLSDDKHNRLKEMAKQQHTSINSLINDAATQMLMEFDAEVRFHVRAKRGAGKEQRGVELLNKAMGE